jgi:hypothetical protein
MSGADGPLSINGTTVYINAGDTKRYSSISIINGGSLYVRGFNELGPETNPGTQPVLIGCSGNCTINTGGTIAAVDNGLLNTDQPGYGATYTKTPVPFDCVYGPVSYSVFGGEGGAGGNNVGYGGGNDTDSFWGHGGGGAGYGNGANTFDDVGWGQSGQGADSGTNEFGGSSVGPYYNGYSAMGQTGGGGETSGQDSYGAGGSGGVRGVSGGCIYLQVGGTISVSGVVLLAHGNTGGDGGTGGVAQTDLPNFSIGGGGGGAGTGGCGGTIIVRYKSGSITSANCDVTAGATGSGGLGGAATGGLGNAPGDPGGTASASSDGLVDIATY